MRVLFNLILIVFPSFLLAFHAHSDLEFTQVIKREFAVDPIGSFKVINKFGKVIINTWPNKKVKVETKIIVNAPSEKDAEKTFDRIKVHFNNNKNWVKTYTEILETRNSWSLPSINSFKSDQFSVEIKVWIPEGFSTFVSMEYGDVILENIKESVDVILKKGDIYLNGIKENIRLDLKLVDGDLGIINNGDLQLQNCNLKIQGANQLIIESQNSTLEVGKAEDIRLRSKYGDYQINSVKTLKNIGRYDDIHIEQVEEVTLNGEETKVIIERLSKSAGINLTESTLYFNLIEKLTQFVDIIGKDSNFKLTIAPDSSFELDATAKYGGISYPKSMKVTKEMIGDNQHRVTGYKQLIGTTKSKISAAIIGGGLRLIQKVP